MLRRDFLRYLNRVGALWLLSGRPLAMAANSKTKPITKKIKSSGALIPAIGMGTWISFNVGDNKKLRDDRTKVLKAFFDHGGGLVDSSPMYGSSEEVLGHALEKLGHPKSLFSATKIWTPDGSETLSQFQKSKSLWSIKKFDLEQIHNLVSWETHLEKLYLLKEKGEIGHIGITTSHGRRHDELERIMKTKDLDFIQLTYNIAEREVEKRLLPLAKEKGIAVIANRPFNGGPLVKDLKKKKFPDWAKEHGCKNWPEYLLKFIVSHPAMTCAIPATTKVEHMNENMGACYGELPDERTRQKMALHVASI